jgi:hypothetical protein
MKFWMAVFWEFVQNVPPMTGFVTALWLWRQQRKKIALICIVVGSVTGALLIRFTEATINNIVEPVSVTITNIFVFSLGMLLFTMYLGAGGLSRWSNWKMDLVLGWGMGILIGVSQALAAGGAHILAVVLHSLAMALPIPLVLMGLRALLKNVRSLTSALTCSVLLALTMTLVIGVVDYAYLLFLP